MYGIEHARLLRRSDRNSGRDVATRIRIAVGLVLCLAAGAAAWFIAGDWYIRAIAWLWGWSA